MTLTELVTLSPFIVLAAMSVVLMLAVAFYRHHLVTVVLTLGGLVLAFMALAVASSTASPQVTPLLVLDRYAVFYIGLLIAASFAVAVLAYGDLAEYDGNREEFYLLLVLATLGSAVLVASSHFASFRADEELVPYEEGAPPQPRPRNRPVAPGQRLLDPAS
jgi:NADH-quinone oxidoreductase subunit N